MDEKQRYVCLPCQTYFNKSYIKTNNFKMLHCNLFKYCGQGAMLAKSEFQVIYSMHKGMNFCILLFGLLSHFY